MLQQSRTSRVGTVAVVAGLTLLFACAINVLIFRTPLYRHVLDPDSTAGIFESTISRLRSLPANPRKDILVLGDSRIYAGLDVTTADLAAQQFHFINAAVPGTTPRCWPFLVRAVDPRADRYRAVVIPLDTYADDDSAIGALDGGERRQDLHYIIYQIRLSDILSLASDFRAYGMLAAIDVLLRGPILRDDVQNLLVAPASRAALVARADADPQGDPVPRLRRHSLSGLRVNFAHRKIVYPAAADSAQRTQLARELLRVPHASPTYAEYRRKWLGQLVAHYRASGTTVIFVRIPAQPARPERAERLGDSIVELSSDGGVILPPAAYRRLERPALFDDYDHLNAAGAIRFSRLLGADVRKTLTSPHADHIAKRTNAKPPISVLPPPSAPQWRWPQVSSLFAWGEPIYFQSYEFFIFFAIVAALFFTVPKRAKTIVLLAASYYFYGRWNSWYLVFLIALTASDFAIALAMERCERHARTALLVLGVAANLAFLGVFKYANFAGGIFATLLHADQPWMLRWLVPIGISFHTFQSISYLVDVYRDKIRPIRSPWDYALYIAFFPQLLAGPIVRAGLFFTELAALSVPSADAIISGGGQILLGIVKKIVIADPFAHVADAYFGGVGSHPGAPAAWSGVLAFAMQIYFDFSGYSDIAIGCARLFGFEFPANFRMPYLATSITEFWHRWNISLSTWLRDYLYIPLGGNRHGRFATYRNLMITMLLGGLWHGASWTFVAWGAYHGALLGVEKALGIGRSAGKKNVVAWMASALLTFTLVTFGWVLFRAPNFHVALQVAHAMIAGGAGQWLIAPSQLLLVVIALVIALFADRGAFAPVRWSRLAQAGAFAVLIVALELLSRPGDVTPYVYFKF
ncbi:MAG: MBOAT family protein [Candidatus Eremiobacteraeota bacterium]|nr:MBOAT family protein [Candidatus Eremiobacteraeota bacterium]